MVTVALFVISFALGAVISYGESIGMYSSRTSWAMIFVFIAVMYLYSYAYS